MNQPINALNHGVSDAIEYILRESRPLELESASTKGLSGSTRTMLETELDVPPLLGLEILSASKLGNDSSGGAGDMGDGDMGPEGDSGGGGDSGGTTTMPSVVGLALTSGRAYSNNRAHELSVETSITLPSAEE